MILPAPPFPRFSAKLVISLENDYHPEDESQVSRQS